MEVRFSDESTLYEFSTAGITVTSYAPTVGKRGETSVTDTIEILIVTNDADSQQDVKDELNNWLALAVEQWETVSESRIFIEIRQADETDWRRSELLGGRLRPNKNTLDSHSLHKQEYILTIERRNWWEWPEEGIALSYDNDHFTTGGQTFLNDGSATFFGDIAGDPQTPIPVRLELTPTIVGGDYYLQDRFLIAHNVFGTVNPNTDEHMLNASDALPDNTGIDSDLTNYNEIDSAAGEEQGLEWDLEATRLAGLGGRWYRMLLRIRTTAATEAIFGKFALYSGGHTTENPLSTTEEISVYDGVTVGYDLVDMGAIRLPTISPNYSSALLNLRFSLRSAAAFTCWLDFVVLAPVDSFHHIESTLTSTYAPDTTIADGRIGRTYMITHDADDNPTFVDAYTDISPHISLWPGRSQWIVVLHRNTANGMDYTQEMTLRAFYRPRRTTV